MGAASMLFPRIGQIFLDLAADGDGIGGLGGTCAEHVKGVIGADRVWAGAAVLPRLPGM
jgi:hypothetical protein